MKKQNLKLQQKIINTNSSEKHYSKRISYIFITKNRTKLFYKALGELKKIKNRNDEIILVNGGDEEIIDNSIDMYIQEPDLNPSHAINKGILIANGKYIKPMADDDLIRKKQLNQAIKLMDANPSIDLLICGGVIEKDNKIYPYYFPEGTNYGENIQNILDNGVCGTGFIIRHTSIPLIGLFPLGIFSDVEFAIQAKSNGAIVKFCRINFFYHPVNEDSVTIKYKNKRQSELEKIYKNYSLKINFFTNLISYNSLPRIIIRYIFKNFFSYFHNKRENKLKLFNQELLDPESKLWDSKFS